MKDNNTGGFPKENGPARPCYSEPSNQQALPQTNMKTYYQIKT